MEGNLPSSFSNTSIEIISSAENCTIVKYSYCGNHVAFNNNNKVTVIPITSGEYHEFAGNGAVDGIDWSHDSDHILYMVSEKKTVKANSLSNKKWTCTICTGKEGLLSAVWSPTGRHILTASEFHLRITIWSVTGGAALFIETENGFDNRSLNFSPSGDLFVLPTVKGRTAKIFSTLDWEKLCDVIYKESLDSTPLWSPTEDIYVVFDSLHMKKTSIVIIDGAKGKAVGGFERENRGAVMGVKSVKWSQSGQLLAIADYNDCIYLVEHLTWSLVSKFSHTKIIFDTKVEVHKMMEEGFKSLKYKPVSFTSTDLILVQNIWRGAREMCFNDETTYLATIASSMPAIIWIWSITELKLVNVIVMKNAVSALAWIGLSTLVICSGLNSVTLWRHGKSYVILIKGLKKSDEIEDIAICPRVLLNNNELILKSKSTIYHSKINHNFASANL